MEGNTMKFFNTGTATFDEMEQTIFNDVRKARFGHLPESPQESNYQMTVMIREWMEYSIDHKVSITENPSNKDSTYNREH
jgi:hypothetical protein